MSLDSVYLPLFFTHHCGTRMNDKNSQVPYKKYFIIEVLFINQISSNVSGLYSQSFASKQIETTVQGISFSYCHE